MGEKTKRESNIELLRIISMLFIVLHHCCVHSDFAFGESSSINRFIVQALSIGGKIGVDIFILITGYFMVYSKFSIKKLIKLVFEIWTYSIIIMLVEYILKMGEISIKASIFPITYELYWFATTYVLLYILSPFINKLIKNIDKDTFIKLLLLLILIQVIIPTFMNARLNFSNLTWFITLYLLGAYMRLYEIQALKNKKRNKIALILCIIIILTSIIIINLFSQIIPRLKSFALYLAGMNKLPIVMISIILFYTFANKKLEYNKWINTVAASTFGVYLIHDNPFMRNMIWKELLNVRMLKESPYLIIYLIIATLLVFTIATLIDQVRKNTIEKISFKIFDKILEKHRKKYYEIKKKIQKILNMQF